MSVRDMIMGPVKSSPGADWRVVNNLNNEPLSEIWGASNVNDIAWSGGQYCIVGNGGKVATSPDGITWTNRTGLSSTAWGTADINHIAWGDGSFRVMTYNGMTATSPDGITWTYGGLISDSLFDMDYWDYIQDHHIEFISLFTFAEGKFICYQEQGDVRLYKWDGGSGHWEYISDYIYAVYSSILTNFLEDYIVRLDYYQIEVRSLINTLISLATLPDNSGHPEGIGAEWDQLKSIASNGSGLWVAVGDNDYVVTSSDNGISWEVNYGIVTAGAYGEWLEKIYWNGSQFIVISSAKRVFSSSNGTSWNDLGYISGTGASGLFLQNIKYLGDKAIAFSNEAFIATSTDSLIYTYRESLGNSSTTWFNTEALGIAWTGTQFCVVGNSGKVATSPDGINWTYQTGLRSTAWGITHVYAITWTGTQFCVVGNSGKVATSPDGITWTNQTGLSSTAWGTSTAYAIAWTGSQFCVAGTGGRIATSPDGITWTYQNNLRANSSWGSFTNIHTIAWLGGILCVLGYGGKIAYSFDGVTWVYVPTVATHPLSPNSFSSALKASVWTGTKLIAVGQSGLVAISP